MKLDRNTQSLKTLQTYEIKDLLPSCKISARSGIMHSGTVYLLPPLAHLTDGIEFGLLPTPVAMDASAGEIIGAEDTFKITKNGNLRKYNRKGTSGSLGLARYVKLLPTPTASDAKESGSLEKLAGYSLIRSGKLSYEIAYQEIHGRKNPCQE